MNSNAMRRPILDSYWVIDGLLLAGSYPIDMRGSGARSRLSAFLDAGIRTFIDLTEERDWLTMYSHTLARLGVDRSIVTGYLRCGIPIQSVPREREHMTSILRVIQEELSMDRPVYVHGNGGLGRTGTVVGCWLVEQGMTGVEAIGRISSLREHTPHATIPSPETIEQIRFVCEWKRCVIPDAACDTPKATSAAPPRDVSGPAVPSAFA